MALNWKPVQPPSRVTLRGRWVTLEPLNADRHSEAIWKTVRGHDEVWTWLADGPYPSESALHTALAEKQASQDAVFLAILPAPGGRVRDDPSAPDPHSAAGYASYMRMDPSHGVVEVGNILFSPCLQRTTAATEAMYLMARHVFDELGYRRYEWKCNAENEPSRRAALRLGFSFEGIFRQHMVIKDRNRDTAWFAMLDHDWPARKRGFEAWLDPANLDRDGRQTQSLQTLIRYETRP